MNTDYPENHASVHTHALVFCYLDSELDERGHKACFEELVGRLGLTPSQFAKVTHCEGREVWGTDEKGHAWTVEVHSYLYGVTKDTWMPLALEAALAVAGRGASLVERGACHKTKISHSSPRG